MSWKLQEEIDSIKQILCFRHPTSIWTWVHPKHVFEGGACLNTEEQEVDQSKLCFVTGVGVFVVSL